MEKEPVFILERGVECRAPFPRRMLFTYIAGGIMNKSELIKELADQSNISFDNASMIVHTFVETMKNSLIEGDRIEIRGFGSFKIKEYGGYAGRNPKTGQSVSVIPKRLPFFRAGKELKEYIND